jgi:hypothetical protein
MPKDQDIDDVLRDWPFEPGAVSARLIHARDGRELLQMRIEMGVLQMETKNRPDAEMPGGAESYLDYLIGEAIHGDENFQLTPEHCIEVDREFVLYYHRRICWLALREFDRAVKDADHTLGMMDFVLEHSPDERWLMNHERYRPFVIFHRTQAAAMEQLEQSAPEMAIERINVGLEKIRLLLQQAQGKEEFDQDEMVGQLTDLQAWIREKYDVGRTLAEQLADAVAGEEYELAAQLRDKISRQQTRMT